MIRPSRSLFKYRWIAIAAAVAPVVSSSSHAGEGSGGLGGIAEREIARRMARAADASKSIERGDKAYAEGDYEGALSEYTAAKNALPDAPLVKQQADIAKAKFADCSVALARDRAKNGRYKEAHQLLDAALEDVPGHKNALQFQKELDDPDRWPRGLTPEHVANVQEVQRLLELANSQVDLGLYDTASETFRDALRKDPYNVAARRGMEAAEQKHGKRRHSGFFIHGRPVEHGL